MNSWKSYTLLSVTYVLLLFLSDYFLLSDDLLFDFFNNQYSEQLANRLLGDSKEWKWLSYLLAPVFLGLRIFLVSVCFSIGVFVINIQVPFKNLLNISILGEYTLLVVPAIKLIWFGIVDLNYNFEDLQYFSPLSIFSLFDPEDIEPWLIYPFQLLNVFEILYWCALAYQLKNILNRDFAGSFAFVASTYGVGLLLWVIFVMFLTVSIT